MTNFQNASPLIHIGYHKTGSKWLQQSVFASPALGFSAPWTVRSAEAIDEFVVPERMQFTPDRARSVFLKGIEQAHEKNLIPVISHEDLCGFPVHGCYYGHEVAERIHAVFPRARILIGVREQQSMLFSMYQQYIRQYGTKSIEGFIGDGRESGGEQPLFRIEHLQYHQLICQYYNLFGADNVLVLPLELLRDNRSRYLQMLFSFVGTTSQLPEEAAVINAGWSGFTLAIRRRINRVLSAPPPRHRPGFGHRSANHICYGVQRVIPKRIHAVIENKWRKIISDRVAGSYSASNLELTGMTGLDLAQYGYDVGVYEGGR